VGDKLDFKLADGTVKTMPIIGIVLDQSTSAVISWLLRWFTPPWAA